MESTQLLIVQVTNDSYVTIQTHLL